MPIADRIDIKRIAQRLTARAAEKSSAFAYEYACIDQETIILHDPRLLADVPGMTVPGMTVPGTASRGLELHGDGRIPSIDLRAYAYYMTQASQKQAHERLQELGLESPLEVPPTSLVAGYPLTPRTHREITVRLATSAEVQAVANFSSCTVPLILFSNWRKVARDSNSHNAHQFITRFSSSSISSDCALCLFAHVLCPVRA